MKRILIAIVMFAPLVGNAQVCKPESILAVTPSIQFTDHGNGTVTDNKTGLMWKVCSEGQIWSAGSCDGDAAGYTWEAALERAQSVNKSGEGAGYSDWRIPNPKELESIAEGQCYLPSINLTVFPNTSQYAVVWSSSPHDSGTAWLVGFAGGGNVFYDKKNSSKNEAGNNGVRLVRSGQ